MSKMKKTMELSKEKWHYFMEHPSVGIVRDVLGYHLGSILCGDMQTLKECIECRKRIIKERPAHIMPAVIEQDKIILAYLKEVETALKAA